MDALGMSAMLGRPVIITAAEPATGRSITVAVDGDRARWAPRSTVVLAGATADAGCLAADRCCRYINFFTTARAARAWGPRPAGYHRHHPATRRGAAHGHRPVRCLAAGDRRRRGLVGVTSARQ
ncbi:MAG: organomercurial lyase [Streptosporangiaceae bacterium]